MKKTLLITGVLLALTASIASAAGIGLYWNDCGLGGGAINKTFACNSNAGLASDMFVTVDPPPGINRTNGHNHFVDLQSATSPLPAWWEFKNPGTCRQAALIAGGDNPATCIDPWQGQASAGVAAYNQNFNGDPSRVRIIGSIAVTSDFATAMLPGSEYYSIRFRMTNAKTVGTGACAGCTTPVCLVANLIIIAQEAADGGNVNVETPIDGGTNYITWQGAFPGPGGCPGATPTQNTTWGKVKSLYR